MNFLSIKTMAYYIGVGSVLFCSSPTQKEIEVPFSRNISFSWNKNFGIIDFYKLQTNAAPENPNSWVSDSSIIPGTDTLFSDSITQINGSIGYRLLAAHVVGTDTFYSLPTNAMLITIPEGQ